MAIPCPHCDRQPAPDYRVSARPVAWPLAWTCPRCRLEWTSEALLDVPVETSAPEIARARRTDRAATHVLWVFAFVFAVTMGGALLALVPLCAMAIADALTLGNVVLFAVVAPVSALAGGFFLRVAAELVLAAALPMMLRREHESVRVRPTGSLRHRRGLVFAAEDLIGVRFAAWQLGLRRAVVVHRAGPAFFLCDADPEGLGALRAELEARLGERSGSAI